MRVYVDNGQAERVAEVLAPYLQRAVPELDEEEAYSEIRWGLEELLVALLEDLMFSAQNPERVGLIKGKLKPDEDCVWLWGELVDVAKTAVRKKAQAAKRGGEPVGRGDEDVRAAG